MLDSYWRSTRALLSCSLWVDICNCCFVLLGEINYDDDDDVRWWCCVDSVITRDDACASKQALGNAIDMWVNESVDLYLGPPCSIGKSLSPITLHHSCHNYWWLCVIVLPEQNSALCPFTEFERYRYHCKPIVRVVVVVLLFFLFLFLFLFLVFVFFFFFLVFYQSLHCGERVAVCCCV